MASLVLEGGQVAGPLTARTSLRLPRTVLLALAPVPVRALELAPTPHPAILPNLQRSTQIISLYVLPRYPCRHLPVKASPPVYDPLSPRACVCMT